MTSHRKAEWLLAEVKAADDAFRRLPEWKQAVLHSRGDQTRHSVDRELSEGQRPGNRKPDTSRRT